MTLLAGFTVLLTRLSSQEEVLVGSPIAGRNRSEVERLIGCFLNTVVLRAGLGHTASFLDLLAQVREADPGGVRHRHQDLPFEKLLEEISRARSVADPALPGIPQHDQRPQTGRRIQGLELSGGPGATVPSNFDLTLYAREQDEQLQLNLVYNVDLFDAARVAEVVRGSRLPGPGARRRSGSWRACRC